MNPSSWLKPHDCGENGVILTIKSITPRKQVNKTTGKETMEYDAEFIENNKKFSLNLTNRNTMFTHYKNSDDWIGKPFRFVSQDGRNPSGQACLVVRVSLKKVEPKEDVPF